MDQLEDRMEVESQEYLDFAGDTVFDERKAIR